MLVPIFGRGWATQGALQMLLAGEAVLGLFLLMKSLLSAGADDVFDEVLALRGLREVRCSWLELAPHPDLIIELYLANLPRALLCCY